jgi:ATPase subunit of ABC transporter with duplicated ATPase domains
MSVVCSNLSFAWPDDTLGYLAQTLSVAAVLGITPALDALATLASGDASDKVFTAIGDDWDIEERSRAQLDRLGLADVALDRPLASLSGGEVVSLGLAAQLLKRPDVLLLDEPTNNLDLDARRKLYDALDEFTGCLLVVSHDRVLLDRMDRIAELHHGEIVFYGGNFSRYAQAVDQTQRAAEDNIRNTEQQLKPEKRQLQQARERAARRSSTAARNVKNAGLPKIVAGKLKRDAQESAAKSDEVHAKRVNDARPPRRRGAGAARRRRDRAGPARHDCARGPHRVRRRGHADLPWWTEDLRGQRH